MQHAERTHDARVQIADNGAVRFLDGNYGPVGEELTVTDLKVEGQIPKALNGRLFRNGPNPGAAIEGHYHWFMGDGMVHGVEFREGRVNWYRNRFVRTRWLAGHSDYPAAPSPTFEQSWQVLMNPGNTSIVAHAGKVLALCETGLPHELSQELDTICEYDFGGRLRRPMTAHPRIDPHTGEMFMLGASMIRPWLSYSVVGADGELQRTEIIDVGGPTVIHDMMLAGDYVLFIDAPVLFDPTMLDSLNNYPTRWFDGYPTRLGVLPRTGGNRDVRWFDIEPCFVFHFFNGVQDGTRISLDGARYQPPYPIETLAANTELYRWTVDLATGKVTEGTLDERNIEYPRVDPRRLGRAYRYGYATRTYSGDPLDPNSGFSPGLIKHDLVTGEAQTWDVGPGRTATEAVFVPNPEGTDEDDGWVLDMVYDATRDGSDLVILDARDISADPLATVRMPQRVPFGFHGAFIADPR